MSLRSGSNDAPMINSDFIPTPLAKNRSIIEEMTYHGEQISGAISDLAIQLNQLMSIGLGTDFTTKMEAVDKTEKIKVSIDGQFNDHIQYLAHLAETLKPLVEQLRETNIRLYGESNSTLGSMKHEVKNAFNTHHDILNRDTPGKREDLTSGS